VSITPATAPSSTGLTVTVDLTTREVRAGGRSWAFDLDDFSRWRLLEGLDDIGLTLKQTDEIVAFEKRMAASQPWLQEARDSRAR